MTIFNRIKKEGLSLKIVSTMMLVFSVLITAILVFAIIRAYTALQDLERSTDVYISLEEQASLLKDASDYLTEEVQRYTVVLDRVHLDNYMTEAHETRRREEAINSIEQSLPDSLALYELSQSMNHSVLLMNREYYAMRLILEATGDTDIPEVLQGVVLTEADARLDAADKIELARSMVHDAAYYSQKNEVRRNLSECLEALKNSTFNSQQGMESIAKRALMSVMVFIIIQSLSICIMLWLHTHLGIAPLLKAVDHIRRDESIPVTGSAEFRYLAGAYNTMFSAFMNSIERLNYKASHDELTGVYNRAGYDVIKNNLDMSSTAMIIVDADEFKQINDHYGHEIGDGVLKKLAMTLKRYHRSDDYVCRIGGDEFVVLMVHLPADPVSLIENKVNQINRDLSDTSDGLPPLSVSVGVSFDNEGPGPEELFRRADKALYNVKQNGRSGCCFYSDELKDIVVPD